MAKKKKTQLRPLGRGFATTSVPKKVVITEEDSEVASTGAGSEEEAKNDVTNHRAGDVPASQAQGEDFDPEKVEEQSLQNLVDKLQEKTEKETTRNVKAVEADRRFTKTLPRLELDSRIVDKIYSLILEIRPVDGGKVIEEPEDKAIAKLAITYGTLRRLGFSEARVEECLRAIDGLDLEEAYEWLYIHCEEHELEANRLAIEPHTPHTPRILGISQASTTPRTPRTPSQFLIPSTPTRPKSNSKLSPKAATFVPSSLSITRESNSDSEMEVFREASTSSSTNNSSDQLPLDDDDLNASYVQLKLRISDLLPPRRQPGDTTSAAVLQNLQARLNGLQKHYFFDEKEAESLYQEERRKQDALSLQARLRGDVGTSSRNTPEPRLNKKKPPNLKPTVVVEHTTSTTDKDFFEEVGEEEQEGGLLGILEEIPSTMTTDQGTTIRIQDMSLPKHWSGRTPKILLAENVAKSDKYAVIAYSTISGASRAKRAAVSIRWEGQKTREWTMDDVACHDEGQAEQYIATVALHAVTHPATEGFAARTSTITGSQTFFRLLPAVYRDLWDELEKARQEREHSINRAVWAKLRDIIEPKLTAPGKMIDKNSKALEEVHERHHFRPVQHSEASSEQLQASFATRQASLAYQEMLEQRNRLPIAQYRQEIISTLETSQVLVLSGETGCGKSTQVPAFILEDQLSRGNHCKIYCTEPRRISAISLAQRVSRELGDAAGAVGTMNSLVGYSIRLESNTTRNTRLAFVTNGIALRMLEGGSGHGGQGTAFDEITHLIIDEVHERTIESDFLLIVLKSLLEQRSDLKVILMSATVDAEKISAFFGGCPTLHVPGRTFPVNVNFLEDAVEFTNWSISENSPFARRLHDKFYKAKNRPDWSEDLMTVDDDDEDTVQENVKLEKRYSPNTTATINLFDERQIPYDLIMRLLENICFKQSSYASYSAAILIFMPGLGEIRRMNDLLGEHPSFGNSRDFRIYPLHSTLSSESQGAVFDIPPARIRKIVIATNIAETGITIPDITCVIDTGKHREMRFDEKRQLSRLVETFIARSNAAQRRGRAGRVQEGLCFHLFTRVRHDTQLAENPLPEMLRLSLSDLALRIKIMKVKLGASIEDVLSRAMDPPIAINVQRAISALVEVRALTSSEEITPMGKLLSKLPTDVHLGKFLLVATLFRCLDPALTIAAALNSKSPFVTPLGMEHEADQAKNSFQVENSDFLTIHNAFSSWRRASSNPGFARTFCRKNYLSHQNLQQIEELRQQFLSYLIDSSFIQVDRAYVKELSRARYGRNRTSRFMPVPAELDRNSGNVPLLNAALTAGLYPKLLVIDLGKGRTAGQHTKQDSSKGGEMRTIGNNQPAAFHPSSVNFRRKLGDFGVGHLAYFTLMHSKRMYAWETGPVDDVSIMLLCGEVDFKLISNSAFVDRKIRYQIPARSNIALKYLRQNLASVLANQFRGKVLNESQILWHDVAMMVLGKEKMDEDEQLAGAH